MVAQGLKAVKDYAPWAFLPGGDLRTTSGRSAPVPRGTCATETSSPPSPQTRIGPPGPPGPSGQRGMPFPAQAPAGTSLPWTRSFSASAETSTRGSSRRELRWRNQALGKPPLVGEPAQILERRPLFQRERPDTRSPKLLEVRSTSEPHTKNRGPANGRTCRSRPKATDARGAARARGAEIEDLHPRGGGPYFHPGAREAVRPLAVDPLGGEERRMLFLNSAERFENGQELLAARARVRTRPGGLPRAVIGVRRESEPHRGDVALRGSAHELSEARGFAEANHEEARGERVERPGMAAAPLPREPTDRGDDVVGGDPPWLVHEKGAVKRGLFEIPLSHSLSGSRSWSASSKGCDRSFSDWRSSSSRIPYSMEGSNTKRISGAERSPSRSASSRRT